MAGIYVSKDVIDQKMGYALIALRNAFDQVAHINQFLANVPVVNGVDGLTSSYSYTADEAYAIRLVFQTFNQVHTDQASTFVTASKFTGLE